MKLVQTQIIKNNHKDYVELDRLCFLSKNLYNATLYCVRQQFFKEKTYLNYATINAEFTHTNQADYRALPAKVSKQTQKLVEQDFLSFFALLKLKAKNKYDKPIRIPKYADKIKGRKPLLYTKDALSFKKKGFIYLSKTNIFIPTNFSREQIKFVRIVPQNQQIKIEIGYEKLEKESIKSNNYAAIDLGINNLATVSSNKIKPLIINGKPLKSINQFANKQVAKYKSLLPKGKYASKRIQNIFNKRENKIKDYFHKASAYIVNQLVSNNISTLIVGRNKGWKQDTDMSKKNNQNFVNIPFYKFQQILKYKCQLNGIKYNEIVESYTSKASFLDNDVIPNFDKNNNQQYSFSGKRIKRGLYKTKNNKTINADLNGSLNILKKYLIEKVAWNENLFSDCVEVSCSKPTICRLSFR